MTKSVSRKNYSHLHKFEESKGKSCGGEALGNRLLTKPNKESVSSGQKSRQKGEEQQHRRQKRTSQRSQWAKKGGRSKEGEKTRSHRTNIRTYIARVIKPLLKSVKTALVCEKKREVSPLINKIRTPEELHTRKKSTGANGHCATVSSPQGTHVGSKA